MRSALMSWRSAYGITQTQSVSADNLGEIRLALAAVNRHSVGYTNELSGIAFLEQAQLSIRVPVVQFWTIKFL